MNSTHQAQPQTVQRIAEGAGNDLINLSQIMTILAENDEGRGRVSGDLVQFPAIMVSKNARAIVRIASDSANWSAQARQKRVK